METKNIIINFKLSCDNHLIKMNPEPHVKDGPLMMMNYYYPLQMSSMHI